MISAIVLAAGTSSRMGQKNKLLLSFKGRTFIQQVVEQLLQSKVGEVIVVLGHEGDEIEQLLSQNKVRFAINDNYKSGMTSSIQAGVKASDLQSDGYLICLSDMPFLMTEDYNQMCAIVTGNREIGVPFYRHHKGNPVFFSKHFKNDILDHKAPEGCRAIVQNNAQYIIKVHFDHPRILRDIDTMEDYEKAGLTP